MYEKNYHSNETNFESWNLTINKQHNVVWAYWQNAFIAYCPEYIPSYYPKLLG